VASQQKTYLATEAQNRHHSLNLKQTVRTAAGQGQYTSQHIEQLNQGRSPAGAASTHSAHRSHVQIT